MCVNYTFFSFYFNLITLDYMWCMEQVEEALQNLLFVVNVEFPIKKTKYLNTTVRLGAYLNVLHLGDGRGYSHSDTLFSNNFGGHLQQESAANEQLCINSQVMVPLLWWVSFHFWGYICLSDCFKLFKLKFVFLVLKQLQDVSQLPVVQRGTPLEPCSVMIKEYDGVP